MRARPIRRAWRIPTLLAATGLVGLPAPLPATPQPPAAAAISLPLPPSVWPARAGWEPTPRRDGGAPGPATSFVSSLAAPGLGQYRQGQRRWLAYAALEAAAVVAFLGARSDARDLRRDYRDFAWNAARHGLSAAPRTDGDFDYFERLSRWSASGRWDADPLRAGIQPETDPTTWNGSVWALALEIFNVDAQAPEGSPRRARALAYYHERGYGPPFLWAWSSAADRERYGNLIAASDDRFRDARLALGLLAANHIVSALDAFASARLAALPDGAGVALAIAVAVP